MNRLSPSQKLMHGIVRLEHIRDLAKANADAAPPPGGEALAQVQQLATEALLILNSLRGQIGGAP